METPTTPFSEHDLEEFHHLYGLRAQISGYAARMAARRVGKGVSSDELKSCWESMRSVAHSGDYAAFLEADMAFHRAIIHLAATPALAETWGVLEEHFRSFASWAQRSLFRDLSMIAEAHRFQLESIAAGDERAAERAAHVDLDALWQMLREQPAEPADVADPVERVCAYVILNLHRPFSLSNIAREIAHLSPSHLSRLFQARHKQSFTAYVQQMRMQRAGRLLRDSQLPVGEVAMRSGYHDLSHFAAHFKRRFGCSPSDYRGVPNGGLEPTMHDLS